MPRALLLSSPLSRLLAAALFLAGCKSGQLQTASGAPLLTGAVTVQVTPTGAKDSGDYTLDFGNVAVGQQQSATLSLANNGTSPLAILAVGAPSDPEFGVALIAGTSVPVGGVASVPVSFKPFSKGAKTATLVVQTDSSLTQNLTLTLQGVGVELNLSVQPQLLDFGDLIVHTTLTKPVTLTNLSPIDLHITPGQVSGPSSMVFQLTQSAVFLLKAGQAQPIEVTYAPLVASHDSAYFTLTPDVGSPLTVTLQGAGLQSGLQITPNPLDFNFVQPGQQRTLPLHLQNAGNQTIHISSVSVSNSANAFALATGAPQSLQLTAGQEADVQVTFSPATGQRYQGELQIVSDDTTGQHNVTLQGYGGGAAISCSPTALDFGVAPIGFTSTLPVICTNTGSDVMNAGAIDPKAELTISSLLVRGGSGVFAATIDPLAPQGSLKAGESTQVDVGYSPAGTESDSATLTVVSNVAAPPAPPVLLPLTGQGIVEKKCYYALTPSAIAFGEVKPGGSSPYTSSFIITNLGPNECVVNGVSLQANSDSAFSLPQGVIASQRLSAPGGDGAFPTSMSVPVGFAPQTSGSFSGQVGFTISDPDAPSVVVPLSGVGGTSCFLVKPLELKFGVVGLSNGQYCSKSKKTFVGVNSCAADVTIQAVATDVSGASPFALLAGTVPVTVGAGQTSPPFQVGFKPIVPGSYYGSAQVQTDLQSTPFGVFFSGEAAVGNQNTDTFQGHTPKVDVLLVMDTDDDLEDLRVPFSMHVGDFVKAAQALNLDFQIGVTTSSDCPSSMGNGLTPNGEQGRIIPCVNCNLPGLTPSVITSADPNAAADVATLVLVNSIERDGCPYPNDDEHFFDVSYKALVYQGPSLDWNTNAGFLRNDAYLSIIQTNGDDEDASDPQTPDWYANQFLSIKGADHPELFSWSYINPSQYGLTGGHTPFDRLPTHISAMLKLVGGVALDMTQDKWWQGVIDLWNIVLASTTRLPLSGTPDPTTLTVYLDGPPPDQTPPGGLPGVLIPQKAPNGSPNWSYDALSNTLDVGANLTLGSSDTLYVTYTLVCQ